MRRTPARRVEPGSALWRGFLASGSSGHDFMRSLSSPRRKVQLPYVIQCIKTAGKLATTSKVNRQFQAPRPNALWLSDFTDVATGQGFVDVAFVIAVFARRIVGWRVSRSA